MSTDAPATTTEQTEPESNGYTKAEQAHYHKIVEAERRLVGLFDKMTRAKDRAKAAKEAYDSGVTDLRELIHTGPDDQKKLPGMEDVDSDPEAWRHVSLADVGLTAKMLKPFEQSEDPDISSLGELADWNTEYALTDIKGIGPKLAEQIEAVIDQFFADHREYVQANTSKDESEDPKTAD